MLKRILVVALALSFLILSYLIFDLISYNNQRSRLSLKKGKNVTEEISGQIDEILREVMKEGSKIASYMGKNRPSKKELLGLLKAKSKSMRSILGVTAAYEPYQFDSEIRLFAPYYDKNSEDYIYIEDVYDYTNPKLQTSQWYVQARDRGRRWIEPYYAEGAQTMVADYGVPFY